MVRVVVQVKVVNDKGGEVSLSSVPSSDVSVNDINTRVIKKVKRVSPNKSTETYSVLDATISTHTDTENFEPELTVLTSSLTLSDKAQKRKGIESGESKQQTTSTSSMAQRSRTTAPLADTDALGPFFCYLMIQLGGPCKNEAKVLVARECFEDAYRHNSGEINDKGTKAARGLWQVEMIVGPFDTRQEADDFKKLWMQDSRGIGPRRDRAIKLINSGACADKVRCFDKRLVPVNLNIWLLENDMACLVLPDDRLCKLHYDCGSPIKRSEGRAPNV